MCAEGLYKDIFLTGKILDENLRVGLFLVGSLVKAESGVAYHLAGIICVLEEFLGVGGVHAHETGVGSRAGDTGVLVVLGH